MVCTRNFEMNRRPSVTLIISMHLAWTNGKSRATCLCEWHAALYGLVALALLQSSCFSKQCPVFVSITVIHFLLVPFVMDRVHNTNFSSRPSLEKQFKSLYNLRIEIVVPALAGYLTRWQLHTCNVSDYKAISFLVNQSYSIVPLFRYSVFHILQHPVCVCVCPTYIT